MSKVRLDFEINQYLVFGRFNWLQQSSELFLLKMLSKVWNFQVTEHALWDQFQTSLGNKESENTSSCGPVDSLLWYFLNNGNSEKKTSLNSKIFAFLEPFYQIFICKLKDLTTRHLDVVLELSRQNGVIESLGTQTCIASLTHSIKRKVFVYID